MKPRDAAPARGTWLMLALAIGIVATSDAAAAGLVSTLRDYGRFGAFIALIERANLARALDTEGPYTLLAPEKVPATLAPESPEAAARLVRHHLLDGTVSLRELRRERPRATSGGHRLEFVDMSGAVLVDNRWILQGDIPADNGLIHIITEALDPRP